VSRKFVAQTETALAELLAADLSRLDLVALMVDGVHFASTCCSPTSSTRPSLVFKPQLPDAPLALGTPVKPLTSQDSATGADVCL
jgi:hypothetical protein